MSDIPDPIEPLVTSLLKEVGEDPGRSGLERTPSRVARSLRYFTTGYEQSPKDILNGALFEVSYDEMVIVKDIEFYSLCEHHLLPFYGRVHVAYIPDGRRSSGSPRFPAPRGRCSLAVSRSRSA